MQTVTSTQNPLVKTLAALSQKKARDTQGLILVETRHPIEEALAAGLTPRYYITLAASSESSRPESGWPQDETRLAGAERLSVSEAVMRKLATTDRCPPCLAVFEQRPAHDPATLLAGLKHPLCLWLDRIQDPGNLGGLIRSACAFGADAILLGAGSADPDSPKVIRAATGLNFRIPVLSPDAGNPAGLYDALIQAHPDLQVLITTSHAQWQDQAPVSYRRIDWRRASLLVLGNEGQGVDAGLTVGDTNTAQAITIPMAPGVESLNVATAGAILLAEAYAQRQDKTP